PLIPSTTHFRSSTHENQPKATAALGAWPFTASRDPQNAMLECRATLSRSVPTGRSQVRGPAPSRAPSTSRKNNWIYESQTLLIVALLAADPLYQSRREQNRLRAQRACRATGLRSGTPRQAGYRRTDRLAQRTRHR